MEYFIPGFIFIRIFQLLTSRKASSYQLILSVVISYIVKALFSIAHNYICTSIVFPWNVRVIILSAAAGILSIILVFITERKFVNKIFFNLNYKSIHDDIWQDIIDYENGTTLRIICDNAEYTGILAAHEEKGNDSWFVLEDYIIKENGKSYRAKDISYPSRIAVNLKDVKRVELFYSQPKKAPLCR
ncbi:MAG: hypothetical protein Q4D94_12820 [Bacillota bacterium]|nr:hypothetical protein [Bacillota bacterium]